MRIVIDMQAAQFESLLKQHVVSFVTAIVRNRGKHEVFLALNALLPEGIDSIKSAFEYLLPPENIRVWYPPENPTAGNSLEGKLDDPARIDEAKLIREAFLSSFSPDFICISGLLRKNKLDFITSIGQIDKKTPVIVTIFEGSNVEADYCPNEGQEFDKELLSSATACLVLATDLPSQIEFEISPDKLIHISSVSENTWDSTALHALEKMYNKIQLNRELKVCRKQKKRQKLALVSPLPPERTGIADYCAELLPALAEYYDIDVVVAQSEVDKKIITQQFPLRDANWLRAHAKEYDRVLYHIGNSHYHHYILQLLNEVPGIVVLHDFYIGHLLAWMENNFERGFWIKSLYSSHGYYAVRHGLKEPESAMFDYPVSLDVVKQARGVIVHSNYSKLIAKEWYGDKVSESWKVIPLLRSPAKLIEKKEAKKQLGYQENNFVLCSFGLLGKTKLNHRLLLCWIHSALMKDKNCYLVFVGEGSQDEYYTELLNIISKYNLQNRISITGYASADVFRQYLQAGDLAVQLRTKSRGETSGTVLDCMNYGLPLIVNSNGAISELNSEAVWCLPDEFDDSQLIEALETLWRDTKQRSVLTEYSRKIISDKHSPKKCAKHYMNAIEEFYQQIGIDTDCLINTIARQNHLLDDYELQSLAIAIDKTLTPLPSLPRIFIDVTVTAMDDYKTGIQRVVRAITSELVNNPPKGYRIEPVRLVEELRGWCYRKASKYTLNTLNLNIDYIQDEIIQPRNGDIILLLDFTGSYLIEAENSNFYKDYRNRGVRVYSVVYDILPITMPEVFPSYASKEHERWATTILNFDGALCISQDVANEFMAWQTSANIARRNNRDFLVGWFHLGADVVNSIPSMGIPGDAEWIFKQFKARPTFLMVGTVEPRKGHFQILKAFSLLWEQGLDANLAIVGKEGWRGIPQDFRQEISETVKQIRNHMEFNKRLFWIEDTSDEYLEKIYTTSSCLIAASYGEGFGLPLIEAAQHCLPIIARDIPIFREVAGEHAFYFQNSDDERLADSIKKWVELYKRGDHLRSDQLPWLTWKESVQQVLKFILSKNSSVKIETY